MDLTFGQISNVLNDKGFGFIKSDMGSVFFHRSACDAWEKLKHGMAVFFKVVDTPKGKAAENVTIADQVTVEQVAKGFIWREDAAPKRGEVKLKGRVHTNYFQAPRDAKNHLRELATSANCNAVLNAEFGRTSIQVGYNYYRTYHYFTGDIALVTETASVLKQNAEVTQHKCNDAIVAAKQGIESVMLEREQSSAPKGSSGVLKWVVAAGFLLAIFL